MNLIEAPPLSVYVHFPWCVSKCPYCDFNSHALRESLPGERYLVSLREDLDAQASRVAGRGVTSVFMGGGTPSLFTPEAIGRVLADLRTRLSFEPDAEVTLEANPATVERGRFAEYRAAGVTRVSLGAQSFDPATLAVLGRIHRPADVARAAEELHAAGLTNFNLDLMYGLPAQSVAGALADLTAALALEPAHLSHYQLTLEPGTLFAARPPPLPDEEACWQIEQETRALLDTHGFAQYEVSAFARAGRQCVHNLNYWRFGDYLGLGAGAHGKLTDPASGRIARSTHLREPRRYQSTAAQGPQWRELAHQDLPFEFMMNALRLNEGFTPALFTARTGLEFAAISDPLQDLQVRGLMERESAHWRASVTGRRFLNDVVGVFLPVTKSQDATGS